MRRMTVIIGLKGPKWKGGHSCQREGLHYCVLEGHVVRVHMASHAGLTHGWPLRGLSLKPAGMAVGEIHVLKIGNPTYAWGS